MQCIVCVNTQWQLTIHRRRQQQRMNPAQQQFERSIQFFTRRKTTKESLQKQSHKKRKRKRKSQVQEQLSTQDIVCQISCSFRIYRLGNVEISGKQLKLELRYNIIIILNLDLYLIFSWDLHFQNDFSLHLVLAFMRVLMQHRIMR